MMTDVPINAKVECKDGPCGKTTNLIVNPVNHKVTHIVVQAKDLPENSTRLVPVDKVTSVTREQVKLDCDKAELAKLAPFIVSNFVQESASRQAYSSGAAYNSQYVINDTAYDSFQEKNIPEGELALHSGMHIEASDGKVGKLDMLVLAPDSGDITHLLLREGHLWGKKDVTIPVSAIDYCDAETVYLKLDKAAIKALPVVPVKQS